jgi:CHASE3 domain sensor protein
MRLLPLPYFRRLLIVPVAMSGLLCLVLGYGLRSVERRSLAVDEADLVIAHSNNLIKLIVDEETGLRGYLLAKDPAFLQPFQVADKRMDSDFLALFELLHGSPNQTKQLAGLQTAHQNWKREAMYCSRHNIRMDCSHHHCKWGMSAFVLHQMRSLFS